MKKMVCEICGAQSIKKEEGVFVCQECGTEYSLEDARKLLQEIDSVGGKPQEQESYKVTSENDKYELLKKLFIWARYLQGVQAFEELKFETTSDEIWRKTKEEIMKIPSIFHNYIDSVKCRRESDRKGEKEIVECQIASKAIHQTLINEEDLSVQVKEMHKMISKKFVFNGGCMIVNYPALYKATVEAGRICAMVIDYDYIMWARAITDYIDLSEEESKIYEYTLFGKRLRCDLFPVLKEIKRIHSKKVNEYNDHYKNEILPEINRRREELFQVLSESEKIEGIFNLPIQYRRFDIVVNLINLVLVGKAETWKEAILLYEEEKFREKMLEKMEELTQVLAQIERTLATGFSMVSEKLNFVADGVDRLNLKVAESNKRLKKIQAFSGITMWNSFE